MATRISILGSTGSIGRSTLEVVRRHPGRFNVVGIAAHSNVDLLLQQVEEFAPRYVAVFDEAAARQLRAALNGSAARPVPEILDGAAGLDELARLEADVVLCAVVGAVGLGPLLAAIEAGNRVALANKEPLVMAGPLIMERARNRGIRVLPVDSEHSAIFQCIEGHDREEVACIHLTASGGPFYGKPRDTLRQVAPEEAVRHPTWDMGPKISVDSATLMNKGLEVIEAMWLFDMPLERVEVIIHPQSIVHGLVEFTDGGILAHLGPTDMKFPIQFALTWPERAPSAMGRLDLASMPALSFAAPDFADFPCLGLARDAARAGGIAPAVLNAANEVAVQAFCDKRIGFLQISDVVREALTHADSSAEVTLESVLAADRGARRRAENLVRTVGA
ncbi:MAG: 1-deoxy-D-xylulose-5-phosphate reductoisomerase [Candidatus Hydrogenedentes bacterium]|nr:1-deoxy-D-xylulose-5-phosphate reductoisomerase [Candidatus Hydrogenedentota bacterium]